MLRTWIRTVLVKLRLIAQPELVGRFTPNHPAPEEILPGELLIVGNQGYQKWACFHCPGGCGESILLSLNTNSHPAWQIKLDALERPTIYPSIRQLNECRCHFWVRNGSVDWCADSQSS